MTLEYIVTAVFQNTAVWSIIRSMGEVREKIRVINLREFGQEADGFIKESQIHQAELTVTVDTGAMGLVLGEKTRELLGLKIIDDSEATLAGGTKQPCKIAETVLLHWKDRYSSINPIILSGREETLMGVIPLEDMDLIVNPVEGRLEGAHGDCWMRYVR
jgi:predicted aspartyl protease